MRSFTKYGTPLLLLATILPATIGCGGGGKKDDDRSYADYDISEETLSGLINGESWTFASGIARDVFGDGELFVELYPVAPEGDDPCSFSAYPISTATVLISVPPTTLDREITWRNSVTFYYTDGEEQINEIVVSGRIIIDDVSDTHLSGKLYATSDESELDGTFSVTVCEPWS